ncbi:MAG: ferrochelatase [Planctomycetota bacterium]
MSAPTAPEIASPQSSTSEPKPLRVSEPARVAETPYQAVLLVSFGGPEGPDDVMPFLENVLRGKRVPRERMLEVAEHYNHNGGVSPINEQCRLLLDALRTEFAENGLDLPIYWGNRNWHPMLGDAVEEMRKDGITRALALMTSAFSSYSGCRQYREDVANACDQSDDRGPDPDALTAGDAPSFGKIRTWFNHPLWIEANADRVRDALDAVPDEHRDDCRLVFTAHSIPSSMARGSDYEVQLAESSRLVCEAVGVSAERMDLVYQSRSGRPQDPWLDPDICDHLEALAGQGAKAVVNVPIGFISDHMEVIYDLDDEAATKAGELGMVWQRAATAGTHPSFVRMLRELVEERLDRSKERRAIGQYGPNHDVCPLNCCPRPARPGAPAAAVPTVGRG